VPRVWPVLVPLSTLWMRDELAYALVHADVELLSRCPAFSGTITWRA